MAIFNIYIQIIQLRLNRWTIWREMIYKGSFMALKANIKRCSMGFSGSARATEPQATEGMLVFALNLLKASAVSDEGNKESEKYKWRNKKYEEG